MVPYFLSFDLPKQIVNGPIQGDGFEGPGARQTFMHIAYDIPLIGHVEFFQGLQLNRFQMLMALSLVFLALVVLNGLFKFYINTYKGRLGNACCAGSASSSSTGCCGFRPSISSG